MDYGFAILDPPVEKHWFEPVLKMKMKMKVWLVAIIQYFIKISVLRKSCECSDHMR